MSESENLHEVTCELTWDKCQKDDAKDLKFSRIFYELGSREAKRETHRARHMSWCDVFEPRFSSTANSAASISLMTQLAADENWSQQLDGITYFSLTEVSQSFDMAGKIASANFHGCLS